MFQGDADLLQSLRLAGFYRCRAHRPVPGLLPGQVEIAPRQELYHLNGFHRLQRWEALRKGTRPAQPADALPGKVLPFRKFRRYLFFYNRATTPGF